MIRFETHGLAELETDLRNAGVKMRPELAKVTGRACNNIKRGARRRWKGMPHLKWLPYSVTYDVWLFGGKIVGEVGADHSKRQGKLAYVAEYGTPTSAPHPGIRPEADKEIPIWEKYIEKAVADVLDGTQSSGFYHDSSGRLRQADGRFATAAQKQMFGAG